MTEDKAEIVGATAYLWHFGGLFVGFELIGDTVESFVWLLVHC